MELEPADGTVTGHGEMPRFWSWSLKHKDSKEDQDYCGEQMLKSDIQKEVKNDFNWKNILKEDPLKYQLNL